MASWHELVTLSNVMHVIDRVAATLKEEWCEDPRVSFVVIFEGFLGDVEIWKHKSRIDNPLLCDEDGPVYQLRRWYEQFYVDVADITPDMTDRFEFEVDTDKANEFWQDEVAANLARKAEEDAAAEAAAAAEGADPALMSGT